MLAKTLPKSPFELSECMLICSCKRLAKILTILDRTVKNGFEVHSRRRYQLQRAPGTRFLLRIPGQANQAFYRFRVGDLVADLSGKYLFIKWEVSGKYFMWVPRLHLEVLASILHSSLVVKWPHFLFYVPQVVCPGCRSHVAASVLMCRSSGYYHKGAIAGWRGQTKFVRAQRYLFC